MAWFVEIYREERCGLSRTFMDMRKRRRIIFISFFELSDINTSDNVMGVVAVGYWCF